MTQICDFCNGFGYTVTISTSEAKTDDTEQEEICEDCNGKGK